MNPNSNEFDPVHEVEVDELKSKLVDDATRAIAAGESKRMDSLLIKPEGTFEPMYEVGDKVEIRGYFFQVMDIGKDRLTLKPLGPYIIGQVDTEPAKV